jgi:predicted small lipoprotein YifL
VNFVPFFRRQKMKKLLAAMLLVMMIVVTGCGEKKPAAKPADKAAPADSKPADAPKAP